MIRGRHSAVKPQVHFKDVIDNSPDTPFIPKLTQKPHAVTPLDITPLYGEDERIYYGHPYETEIQNFDPSVDQLIRCEPQPPLPLDDTPLLYITKVTDLINCIEELRKEKEISVDVEHHSERSFLGITCLIQISTRTRDIVIDAIKLRNELQALNHITTDPNIVKVFHGAHLDVLWLQRDLGIYIVNLFDTFYAARLLEYPTCGLSELLKIFCNVTTNKKFQRSDWRLPLTPLKLKYVREDTHYLLFIYDQLKNQLLDTGNRVLLMEAMEESKKIALARFEKPLLDQKACKKIWHRGRTKETPLFDLRQRFSLEHLCQWRDKTAREMDESPGYILPNKMLVNISTALPTSNADILKCCQPVNALPLLSELCDQVTKIIEKARSIPKYPFHTISLRSHYA